MKKYMPIVLLVGLTFGMNSGVALGAPDTATTTQAEKNATTTAKADAAKQNGVKTAAENAIKRLTSVLEKQAVVGVKIESRIVKLGAAGKDISEAIEKTKAAHDLWDIARVDFEALPGVIQNALDSQKPKDAKETIKAAFRKVVDEAKASQNSLGEVIAFLKAGLPDAPVPQQ